MRSLRIGVCLWLCLLLVDAQAQGLGGLEGLNLLAGGTLQQWVGADGTPVSSPKWQLQDGVLHLTAGGGGDLFYRNPVNDFQFAFEWKISPRGNSGVKYRVQKYGGSWLGCEYQIEDRGEDSPLTNQSTGALYAVYEPNRAGQPLPPGEWNRSTIRVVGNCIEHWLNGGLVVSANAGSLDWLQRVAASKFAPHPGWGQNRIGRLMLQDHGNEVWFRNLRLTNFAETGSVACPIVASATCGNANCELAPGQASCEVHFHWVPPNRRRHGILLRRRR